MGQSRFTDDQKKAILDLTKSGTSVRKVCCQYDISTATFYHWRRQQEIVDFDPMAPSTAIRQSAPFGRPRKTNLRQKVSQGRDPGYNVMNRNGSDAAEVAGALMPHEPVDTNL